MTFLQKERLIWTCRQSGFSVFWDFKGCLPFPSILAPLRGLVTINGQDSHRSYGLSLNRGGPRGVFESSHSTRHAVGGRSSIVCGRISAVAGLRRSSGVRFQGRARSALVLRLGRVGVVAAVIASTFVAALVWRSLVPVAVVVSLTVAVIVSIVVAIIISTIASVVISIIVVIAPIVIVPIIASVIIASIVISIVVSPIVVTIPFGSSRRLILFFGYCLFASDHFALDLVIRFCQDGIN